MADREPIDQRLLVQLAAIGRMEPMVDRTHCDAYVPAAGWNIDARDNSLPAEAPGPPAEKGSFAAARRCGTTQLSDAAPAVSASTQSPSVNPAAKSLNAGAQPVETRVALLTR